jgi:hypothetical protein
MVVTSNGKSIINLNFNNEFYGESEAVEVTQDGCNLAGLYGQFTKVPSIYISWVCGLLYSLLVELFHKDITYLISCTLPLPIGS